MRDSSKKETNFEIIFRENYSRLYYHAMSFLNDHEVSKDVVNDAFETLWTRYDHLELSTSITPLLYTLVRNSCVNYLRHLKSQEHFLADALWTMEEAMEEEDSEREELVNRLRESIELLPEQIKIVFKRCFLDGKKYREVADELDISINTVKAHVKKALRLLRERFSDEQLVLYVVFTRGR